MNGGGTIIGGSLIALGATNVRLSGFSVGGHVIIRGGGGNLVIATSTVRGVVDVSGVNGFIAIINNESAGALGHVRVANNVSSRSIPQVRSGSTSPRTRFVPMPWCRTTRGP